MINLSKTQSVKQQILAAVSTGSDLTLSQIRYLQDVLPEKDKSSELNFDHSKGNTWEACGLSMEQVEQAQNEVNNLIDEYMSSSENPTKSGLIEKILLKGSKTLFNVLIIDSVRQKFERKDGPYMDDMMKLMQLIAKMKGDK